MTPTLEEAFRRQRTLALFCALQAFQRDLTSIWIRRQILIEYLEIEKIMLEREAWIQEDFLPWFPFYRLHQETEKQVMIDRHIFSKASIDIAVKAVCSKRSIDTFRHDVPYATPESGFYDYALKRYVEGVEPPAILQMPNCEELIYPKGGLSYPVLAQELSHYATGALAPRVAFGFKG
jgi:hypothetical protein